MNKHILLVMKYLKDPKSVSQEELGENRKSAADAAYDAAYAYIAAYYAATDAAADAAHWVDEYFEHTGEDKQTYINELEKS